MTHPTPAAPVWLEISINAPLVAHEALNAFLFDLGCQGVVLTESPEPHLKGYLAAPFDTRSLQTQLQFFIEDLQNIFPEAELVQWTLSEIKTEDWAGNWKQFFKPDKITPRLMIVPVWEPIPPDPPEWIIKMDPGPAFGTGQHATTRMCLAALETISLKPNGTLLDVGTGSGILAIYGVKLGAGHVTALDNDPEALLWAKRNIEINQVSDQITLSDQPLAQVTARFPLMIANLILGTILELAPHFAPRLDPDGRLVLSGLLKDQAPEVEAVMKTQGLVLEKTMRQKDWVCLVFKRPEAYV